MAPSDLERWIFESALNWRASRNFLRALGHGPGLRNADWSCTCCNRPLTETKALTTIDVTTDLGVFQILACNDCYELLSERELKIEDAREAGLAGTL